MSHLTRGAWIEIQLPLTNTESSRSRTSHEVRGLKYHCTRTATIWRMSHLTRGAWIEIMTDTEEILKISRRTSHEVRGLKSVCCVATVTIVCCRTSHEVRGLKCVDIVSVRYAGSVAPHTRCVD